MKHFILLGLILALLFTALFISCNNEVQGSSNSDVLKTSEILKENGNIHNSGLDYIKNNALKTNNKCTQQYIGEVLGEYVRSIYDKDEANKIIQEIVPVQKQVFKHIPSLSQTRSSNSTNMAMFATNESMNKIKQHLASFSNDEVFDNKKILDDLHLLICQTYEIYVKKCNSNDEKQALAQSLGVLYGSIEYWTNSENVEFWSKYKMDKNGKLSSKNLLNTRGKGNKEKDKDKNKKLSRKEYIEVVAAADVAGSYLGGGFASAPAAVAASAAAALYFDVKD